MTGKGGGIKVIDGSSVKFGRFDGAEPHCVGLTDLRPETTQQYGRWFHAVGERLLPWTLNYDEIDMVLEGAACSPRRRNYDRQSGRCDVYPERLQHRIWYDIQREIRMSPGRLTGNFMKDFITEAWLRANHTPSAKAQRSISLRTVA